MPTESLDELLDRIGELHAKGESREARKLLKSARKAHPDELGLVEWEAVFTVDDGDHEAALKILDRVLATDASRVFAARERAQVLENLWMFDDARKQLEQLLRKIPEEWLPIDEAEARHSLACCLDRLEQGEAAERQFREAARLAPDEFFVPSRHGAAEFEAIVKRSLEAIPEDLKPSLEQVHVVVRNYPLLGAPDPYALGLYDGLPRTERTHADRDHLDTVFIFQRTHEIFVKPEDLAEEIWKTVVHEIAHHFGLGEDDMGEYA